MSHPRLSLLLLLLACSPAGAFEELGSIWDADRGPVHFHLEPSGSDDISDGSDLEAVRNAFRRWSCVEGSRLRMLEGEGAGAKEGDSGDGRNSVFWDEDGSYGLGIATLGITLGPAPREGELVERTWSTIVFNGTGHEWSTRDDLALADDSVDVESIAVHEAGHWLGLGHPCEDAEETVCKDHSEAVMHPTYPGGLLRELGSDDVAGIRALYPQDDDSSCDGPFRQGEPCSCNDECVAGLLCVPTADGGGLCAPACDSDDVSCPNDFACVLRAAAGDGVAPGLCLKREGEGAPAGAVCQRDDECAEGLCARADPVGRTICRVGCDVDSDCPAEHACTSGVCLSAASEDGLPCGGDVVEEGCTCSGTSTIVGGRARDALLSGLLCLTLMCLLTRSTRARGSRRGSKRKRPESGAARLPWDSV